MAEALHFVAHHGDNEDALLLPMLHERAPEVAARMQAAHSSLDEARRVLLLDSPCSKLYLAACAFTAQYLLHMDDEDRALEPGIRAVLSGDGRAPRPRGSKRS